MPFGAVKGGQSHENNQYWNSCPCRRWKDDLDGEPAICQRSHFRPGSVEKGTTRTDTMFLERQRGITIQAAVTSFQWHRCKVNIVDTPGHMDFLAEVYRSLAVLDGAILVISAKDGVQAQTRILFHALRKMNIPTLSLSTRSTRLALICRAWFSLFGISSPAILSSSRRCRCPGNSPGGKYRHRSMGCGHRK